MTDRTILNAGRSDTSKRSKLDRKKQKSSLALFHPFLLILPPVVLSAPLGMPNNFSQLLALASLLPLVLCCLLRALHKPGFVFLIVGVLFISLLHIVTDPDRQHSLYQAIRSFLPFFCAAVIIVSSTDIITALSSFINRDPERWKKSIDLTVIVFCAFSALQTLAFFSGLPLANALSSASSGRVMIFQTTSCILLLFFGVVRGNYFIIASTFFVVLGTGSKAAFIASVAVALLAIIPKFSFQKIVKITAGALLFTTVLMVTKPPVLDRLSDFVYGTSSQNKTAFSDVTREYEIAQAKSTFSSSMINTLFGAGFSMQVSRGVPTPDPAWRENSKYDIENGYWGVLAKLGVLFSALFILNGLVYLPKNATILALVLIEFIIFFKTSYQIFAYFDGCMILLWAIIISIAIRLDVWKASPWELRKQGLIEHDLNHKHSIGSDDESEKS